MKRRRMDAHPIANLFPMLPDDELNDLAADIKQRGLLQPIVRDQQGRILDGRNRYAACEIAGVEPTFVDYDGDDPDGYALAVNIARRHLNKGMQAMVVARAMTVTSSNSTRKAGKSVGMSNAHIARAQTVLKFAPDLADSVLSGAISLNVAYDEAKERKDAAASDEALMAKLRGAAPDLADQVVEERLTLKEAWAAKRERDAEHERQQRVATHLLCEHLVTIAQMRDLKEAIPAIQYNPEMALPGRNVTMQTLLDAQAALEQLTTIWKERGLE